MSDINFKNMFIDTGTSLETHMSIQRFKREGYWTTLYELLHNGVILTTTSLAKVFATTMAANDTDNVIRLLSNEAYKLPEILKTCQILDSRRLIKQMEKKITILQNQNVTGRRINLLRSKLNNLRDINENINFSLTSTKIRLIKKYWINKIPKDKLEFYALSYGLTYWKELMDILHTKPTDFQLEWFQAYTFGSPAPEGSIVGVCKNLTTSTALEIIKTYKPDYNYLRRLDIQFNDETKDFIASYTSINTIIWWLNELSTPKVDKIVLDRLKIGADIDLPYGVIVDKLFALKQKPELFAEFTKLAERKLSSYNITLEQPVVVLGDASASMDIAIKTSSIIMSILCALCNAEMRLFRSKDEKIENPPRNVKDVILFNNICKAHSSTSPAASLYPYLSGKKIIKTFIVVTDEEENTKYADMSFANMFKQYTSTIYPAKLVFVSFLANEASGIMYNALQHEMPEYMEHVTRIIFNRQKPDMTKLDDLLAKISYIKYSDVTSVGNDEIVKVCI